jgi:hypothetical protein
VTVAVAAPVGGTPVALDAPPSSSSDEHAAATRVSVATNTATFLQAATASS